MPHATLRTEPEPAIGPGGQRLTLDCGHGTTVGYLLPGTAPIPQNEILRALLERHDREERCGCTRRLWRKMRTAAPRCPERRPRTKRPARGPKTLDKTHFGGKN